MDVELKSMIKQVWRGVFNATMKTKRPSGRPIVIVGNGRSGTSWVGDAFAQAPGVVYYREPCNPSRTGVKDDTVWSRYVPPDGEDAYFERHLSAAFKGSLLPERVSPGQLLDHLANPYRVVVKEVAVFFSVEWMYMKWQPEILCVVRHPCGCALSVYNAGIYKREEARVRQIIEDEHVSERVSHLIDHIAAASTPLEISAAIWAVKNYMAVDAMKRYDGWTMVQYEDLCQDPVDEFKQLYQHYSLSWTDDVERWMRSTTEHEVPGTYSTSRVSSRRADAWKRVLTSEQIREVRSMVEPFELPFYNRAVDW